MHQTNRLTDAGTQCAHGHDDDNTDNTHRPGDESAGRAHIHHGHSVAAGHAGRRDPRVGGGYGGDCTAQRDRADAGGAE